MSYYEPLADSTQATGGNVPIKSHYETEINRTETDAKVDNSDIVSKISGREIELDFGKHKFAKDRSSKQRKSDPATEDHRRTPLLKPEPEGDIDAKLYNACLTGNLNLVKDILDKHYTTLMPDEEGRTPLYAACIGNQPEIVKYLVHRGYDVNHQDNQGKTPLHVAYEWNVMGIVKLLIRRFNARVSMRDARQWTPFHLSIDIGYYSISPVLLKKFFEADVGKDVAWIQLHAACHVGDLEKIKILLATGANIHQASSIGYTPLHVACTENKPGVVRYLLEHGANKDVQHAVKDGFFPVHIACVSSGPGVLQDLLEYGADPNTTAKGLTAAHLAVEANKYATVQCLLAWSTTDLNAVDKGGDTCLHRAVANRNLDMVALLLQKELDVNSLNYRCLTPLHIAIHKNERSIVEKLLAAKADPNVRDVDGDSSLMIALHKQRWNMIEMLLASGANVDASNSDGDSCLHLAVMRDCGLQTVQTLIQYKASLNSVNHKLQTPLLLACAKYQKEVINVLLESGADPTVPDKRGQTCFHWLAAHEDCDKDAVQTLLEYGAHRDVKDCKSRTALHYACLGEHWDNMMTLLSAGADPNIADLDGDNALHCAVDKNCNPEGLQALIDHGVKINAQNNNLQTALHVACMTGQTRTVKILLASGVNPNIADYHGNTALHRVAYRGCHLDSVQHLVTHGAEVNKVNKQSETAVLLSLSKQHIDIAGELLKFGADPNIPDDEGETCLHWAVHRACEREVLQDLIVHGADPDTLDHRHRTALFLACCNQNLPLIDVLLNAGANPNIVHVDGKTILHTAIHKHVNTQILQKVIDHGAYLDVLDEKQRTALLLACMSEQVEAVRELLNNGANPDVSAVSGYRCLHKAVDKRNAELVEVLLSHPLDINVVNDQQQTALYMACAIGERSIAKLLMAKGADLNKVNPLHNTPLHIAIKHGASEIVGDLLEQGADPNIKGQHGMTPLHVTVSYDSEQCMKELLRYKPNLNIQDNDGDTPLTAACKTGLQTLALLLLQRGADTQILNAKGLRALDYAVTQCNKPMMEAFFDHDSSVLNAVVQDNETVLHYFCRKGKTEVVEWLVSRGADKDKVCVHGSPLDVAHSNGHKNIVFMLIDAGADASRVKSVGRLGFMDKIYQQRHLHMDTLKHMILSDKCRVDLTAVNEDHETLLLQACRDDAVDVVETMLESTKDPGVNICNKFGKSPTIVVCENSGKTQNDSVTLLSMLLRKQKTVDLSCTDYTGMTPLHIVSKNDQLMMANMLLSVCQILANTGDSMARTPLHLAKSSEMVKFLVNRGADVNERDFLGRTPLLYCCEHGNHEAAVALMKLQPDAINFQDNLGRTVLHLCASSKVLGVLKDIKAVQVNKMTINKQTALHVAVIQNDVQSTQQLLKMGADPSVVDKNHLSPLHLAANPKCWELLLQHKAGTSMLSRHGDSPDTMKQWHVQLEATKTTDLWPEIISHGHDTLYKIMQMPFVGFIDVNKQEHKEQQLILSQLKQFMNKLKQEVQQIDPLVAFEVKPVGSFQEGTTVGLPDEVGFLCLLHKVPEILEPPKKLPYSNTTVTLHIKSNIHGDRPNFVDHNGDVMGFVLSQRFSNAILRALATPAIWKDFPQLYLVNWRNGPGLTLQLIWHGTVYKWLPLSVDIAPGLVFQDWQPSWIETKHATMARRCCVLFKNIAHVEESERSVFELGFAEAEAELLNQMSPQLKAGFQLAKLMRHSCICSPLKTIDGQPQQPATLVISEDTLRTVTFHLHEELMRSDQLLGAAETGQVIRAAQLIYERLATALNQNVLRMYMFPSHNILLEHFQSLRSHEGRELARQYCRKINNLLQKQPTPNLK